MNLRQWLTRTDTPIGEIATRLGVTMGTLRRWSEEGVPMTRRADVLLVSDGEIKFAENIPPTIEVAFLIKDCILQLEEYQIWQQERQDRQLLQWILNGLYKIDEHLRG